MSMRRSGRWRVALLAAAAVANAMAASAAEHSVSGQKVYEHWCAPCHAPGPGHPGTQSLQVKYGGRTPAVLLERTDLSREAIATFVRTGVLSMPPFRKTEVSDADLSALTRYMAEAAKKR